MRNPALERDEDFRAAAHDPDLEPFKGVCAECGKWAVIDEDLFCAECARTRRPCDACGASLPLKELELADGHHLCQNCLRGYRHVMAVCK
jgi:hypothetical protein